MGKLSPQETLLELLRAKLPAERYSLRTERMLADATTMFIVRRESDSLDAVLTIPDSDLVQIDYPDLLATAIVDTVLIQFGVTDA